MEDYVKNQAVSFDEASGRDHAFAERYLKPCPDAYWHRGLAPPTGLAPVGQLCEPCSPSVRIHRVRVRSAPPTTPSLDN